MITWTRCIDSGREQWCCNPTCTSQYACTFLRKCLLHCLIYFALSHPQQLELFHVASHTFKHFQTLTRRMDFPPLRYFLHIHRSLKPLWHMTQSEVITCFSVMLGMLGVPDKRITWREASISLTTINLVRTMITVTSTMSRGPTIWSSSWSMCTMRTMPFLTNESSIATNGWKEYWWFELVP